MELFASLFLLSKYVKIDFTLLVLILVSCFFLLLFLLFLFFVSGLCDGDGGKSFTSLVCEGGGGLQEEVVVDEDLGVVCGGVIEELLEVEEGDGGTVIAFEGSSFSSGGRGFIEELSCVEEGGGGWSIGGRGFIEGVVCEGFIEELLEVEGEGEAMVTSDDKLFSSGGRGFIEELPCVEEGGGGWSVGGGGFTEGLSCIEEGGDGWGAGGGPIEDIPVEQAAGDVAEPGPFFLSICFLHISGIVFFILLSLNFNFFFSPRAVLSPSLCLLLAADLGVASLVLDGIGDEDEDDVGELPDEFMSDVGGSG